MKLKALKVIIAWFQISRDKSPIPHLKKKGKKGKTRIDPRSLGYYLRSRILIPGFKLVATRGFLLKVTKPNFWTKRLLEQTRIHCICAKRNISRDGGNMTTCFTKRVTPKITVRMLN